MSEYNITQQAYYWLAQMEDHPLTVGEKQEFHAWLNSNPKHTIAFAEAELLWKAMSEKQLQDELAVMLPEQKPTSTFIAWSDRCKQLFSQYRLAWLTTGVAVTITCLLVLQQSVFRTTPELPELVEVKNSQTYSTEKGKSRTFALDDGSLVQLDAGSEVEVSYTALQRRVLLVNGSAFFDVSHDPLRPFVVASGAVEVEVTGTEFDVQRKQDQVYVAVEEGSVNVSQPLPGWHEKNAAKNNQTWSRRKNATLAKTSLSQGQGIKVHRLDGLGKVEALAPELLATWRRGKLVYINRSLDEVVQDMNRYSQTLVSIEADIADLKLSGTFDSKDIPAMLKVIQLALPVVVEKEPDKFHLRASLTN